MIKVLVVQADGLDASAFYRSAPFSKLKGVEVTFSNTINWATLYDKEIVIVPRPHTPNLLSVVEYAKTCKKKIIIDTDDDLFNVPETNPSYKVLMSPIAQECYIASLKLADIVITSTESIKQEILKRVPGADVRVILNSVDDELFDLTPSFHTRERIICVRGGGSHSADIEAYKGAILQLIQDYPEYKWAMMGYCPKWIADALPDDRLMVFQYTDLMKYFETLMELKPEIMIVPLEDNVFNKGKSNIAWIEGTLAGSIVIGPKYLPEFDNEGIYNINKLKVWFDWVKNHPETGRTYEYSVSILPKLSEVNELRLDIIEELSKSKPKFTIGSTQTPKPATDQEFFNHCLTHGYTQESEEYKSLHNQTINWIQQNIKPQTVVEFGCGSGYYIEKFNELGVACNGLELNPKFIEYFNSRNPELTEYIHKYDFTQLASKAQLGLEDCLVVGLGDAPEGIATNGIDLGISIEVFEHIDMSEERWDLFISNLSMFFKNFLFSSTPFRDNPKWDKYWGHINIRTPKSWVNLFERNGWKLANKPKTPTPWTLHFISENI